LKYGRFGRSESVKGVSEAWNGRTDSRDRRGHSNIIRGKDENLKDWP
jgi:hypothetical protein